MLQVELVSNHAQQYYSYQYSSYRKVLLLISRQSCSSQLELYQQLASQSTVVVQYQCSSYLYLPTYLCSATQQSDSAGSSTLKQYCSSALASYSYSRYFYTCYSGVAEQIQSTCYCWSWGILVWWKYGRASRTASRVLCEMLCEMRGDQQSNEIDEISGQFFSCFYFFSASGILIRTYHCRSTTRSLSYNDDYRPSVGYRSKVWSLQV